MLLYSLANRIFGKQVEKSLPLKQIQFLAIPNQPKVWTLYWTEDGQGHYAAFKPKVDAIAQSVLRQPA
jgi:hypothetical protein